MEQRSLPQIAEDTLLATVQACNGFDVAEVDSLITHVISEMTAIVVLNEQRWPQGTGEKLGPIIVNELNRLLRQGKLMIGADRTLLYFKVQDHPLYLVSSRP